MTKLVTKDNGIMEFNLPDCPICCEQPMSDFFTVKCGCRNTSETPEEYIKRCRMVNHSGANKISH